MRKINPAYKKYVKLPNVKLPNVKQKAIKLSDKTIEKKELATIFFSELGEFFLFLFNTFKETFSREFEFKEFLRQCFQIGNRTLPLISVTGVVIGLVLTIQSRPVLAEFGAVSMLPGMVAVSIIREMGPVVTALICAGRIGSGMGAELGSMKVTEQIDAMEVSSTNPMRFLVVTRVLAATLMIPILVLYADALGILGSWAGANIKGDVPFVLFISQAFAAIGFDDLLPAVAKTIFFGAAIGLVGCYKGYTAGRGTESVGKAATSAVVLSSLFVILIDLIAVQITDML
ncbi:MlaE family ABC transporter permease [Geofilum rubicundum]|uniref:ABC transporter permease protein n=1 Tax=Geofilum rubicundum JCM 15548 TaxID=1236989 RepID=A0A0E9M2V4_9BACT|nr:ABC transporter permease [Geofilum rubicundum]GAO31465.1 ABC transporter permease protein [Geofilum rubicundum JCM 15548]